MYGSLFDDIYEISFKSQVKKYLNLILSFLDWFEKNPQ